MERGDVDQAIKMHNGNPAHDSLATSHLKQSPISSKLTSSMPEDDMLIKVDKLNEEVRGLLLKYSNQPKVEASNELSFPKSEHQGLTTNTLSMADRSEFGMDVLAGRLKASHQDGRRSVDSDQFGSLDAIYGKATGLDDISCRFDTHDLQLDGKFADESIISVRRDSKADVSHDDEGLLDHGSGGGGELEIGCGIRGARPDRDKLGEGIGGVMDNGWMDCLHDRLDSHGRSDGSKVYSRDVETHKMLTDGEDKKERVSRMSVVVKEEIRFKGEDEDYMDRMKDIVKNTRREIESLLGPDDQSFQRLTGQNFGGSTTRFSEYKGGENIPEKNQPSENAVYFRTTPGLTRVSVNQKSTNSGAFIKSTNSAQADNPLALLQQMKTSQKQKLMFSEPEKVTFASINDPPIGINHHQTLVRQDEDSDDQPPIRKLPPNQVKTTSLGAGQNKSVASYYDKIPASRLRTKEQPSRNPAVQQPTIKKQDYDYQEDDSDEEDFCLRRQLKH